MKYARCAIQRGNLEYPSGRRNYPPRLLRDTLIHSTTVFTNRRNMKNVRPSLSRSLLTTTGQSFVRPVAPSGVPGRRQVSASATRSPTLNQGPDSGAALLYAAEARTTRNPMLLFLLSGLFLLRLAARRFLALLFQEPPRRTRSASPIPFETRTPS